jgi:hypothetical protein
MSPEALAEARELQRLAAHIRLNSLVDDSQSYVWGSPKFTSKKYYEFCFRNTVPHKAFKWV